MLADRPQLCHNPNTLRHPEMLDKIRSETLVNKQYSGTVPETLPQIGQQIQNQNKLQLMYSLVLALTAPKLPTLPFAPITKDTHYPSLVEAQTGGFHWAGGPH